MGGQLLAVLGLEFAAIELDFDFKPALRVSDNTCYRAVTG
jgi:hypothetical protein